MSLFRNNSLALFLSLMVVVASFAYIYSVNHASSQPIIQVTDGEVYLEAGLLDTRKVYRLDGVWEFYPDQHIYSENSGVIDLESLDKKYIPLPASWKGYLFNPETSQGIGTYRLVMQIDPACLGQEIGIRVNKARSASKAYINGIEVGGNGNPDPGNLSSFNRPYFASFFLTTEELELVIQVNNELTVNGGITQPIYFGSKSAVQLDHFKTRLISLIAIATAIITSISFFVAFMYARRQKSLLYFSFFCLSLGFMLSGIGEVLLKELLLDMPYEFFSLLVMNSFFLVILFFTLFFQEIFTESIGLDGQDDELLKIKKDKLARSKRLAYPTTLVTIALLTALMLNTEPALYPMHIILNLFPLALVTVVIMFFYTMYVLINNINADKERRGYLLVILVSVLSFFASYAYSMYNDLNRKNLLDIIVLLVIAVFISLFLKQFQLVSRQLDQRTNELVLERELRENALLATIAEIKKVLKRSIQPNIYLETSPTRNIDKEQHYQESFYNVRSASDTIDHLLEEIQILTRTKSVLQLQDRAEEISIRDLENLVAEIQAIACRESEIQIEIIDQRPPNTNKAIFLYKKHFCQIMSNLIINAITAIEVRQKQEDFPGLIKIVLTDQDQRFKLEIIDNGTGIEAQDVDYLFQPFYKKSLESLGIGLSLSQKLARTYQGDISYKAVKTGGASFCLSLPYQELEVISGPGQKVEDKGLQVLAPKTSNFGPVSKSAAYKGKRSLLIISRERDLSQQLEALFKENYHLFLTTNIAKGIEVVQTERIDLIVTDNLNEDQTGLDLARELREDNKYAAIPIYLLTRVGRKIIEKYHGIQANIIEYMELPLDAKKILADIQALEVLQYARDLAIEKELKFLHVQITPHFLFNSLNTIIGLSMTDQEQARYALENLADYLHLKLDLVGSELYIPIDKEIDLVNAYLNIEQIRFQDQLIIDMEIDPDIVIEIPPLTIQPLVENAIHHGIRMSGYPEATLTLRIERVPGGVMILIADDGLGMTPEELEKLLAGQTEGVGFYNVKRKLELIEGARLEVKSAPEQGTEIRIYLTNN